MDIGYISIGVTSEFFLVVSNINQIIIDFLSFKLNSKNVNFNTFIVYHAGPVLKSFIMYYNIQVICNQIFYIEILNIKIKIGKACFIFYIIYIQIRY